MAIQKNGNSYRFKCAKCNTYGPPRNDMASAKVDEKKHIASKHSGKRY